MTYSATYPLAAQRASVSPQQPGFIGPKAAVPEFRWVPPAGFATTYPVSMSPSGLFPYGPAYASPPQTGCPSCLRGLGMFGPEDMSSQWGTVQYKCQEYRTSKDEVRQGWNGPILLHELVTYYSMRGLSKGGSLSNPEEALSADEQAKVRHYEALIRSKPGVNEVAGPKWLADVKAVADDVCGKPEPGSSALQSKGLFILAAAAGVLLLGLYIAEQKAPRRKR